MGELIAYNDHGTIGVRDDDPKIMRTAKGPHRHPLTRGKIVRKERRAHPKMVPAWGLLRPPL